MTTKKAAQAKAQPIANAGVIDASVLKPETFEDMSLAFPGVWDDPEADQPGYIWQSFAQLHAAFVAFIEAQGIDPEAFTFIVAPHDDNGLPDLDAEPLSFTFDEVLARAEKALAIDPHDHLYDYDDTIDTLKGHAEAMRVQVENALSYAKSTVRWIFFAGVGGGISIALAFSIARSTFGW